MKSFNLIRRVKIFTAFIGYFLLLNSGLLAQSPQAFKYQAVIRNLSGDPVVSTLIGLRISILKDSSTGPPVYVETQNAPSSIIGVVSLDIGKGTPVSGILDSVKWKNGPFFLQVEADITGGTNYQLFGSSAILGVPYALYALNGNPGPKGDPGTSSWIDGPNQVTTGSRVGIGELNPTSRLDIKQDSTSTDTILFEVKDKTGLPIFAVLESGVRVYVKPGSKGSKGGFSVGGRTTSKTGPEDLLWVTSDSIRMYINNPVKKGSKGGFAVGGRTSSKAQIENFTLLTPDNYLIGQGAGKSLTSGTTNAFLGYRAGQNTTTGSQNIFLGHYAGFSNDSGMMNVFIGDSSGYYNTWGSYNIFIGTTAGRSDTSGFENIALGIQSGYSLQDGNRNIMIGSLSGEYTTSGIANVFIGNATGMTNTTGSFNVFLGRNAGIYSTTGLRNVFLGHQAGYLNSVGSTNIYIGDRSGFNSDSSSNNVYIGQMSGYAGHNTTSNVFIGNRSGFNNISGTGGTFIGFMAGLNNINGSFNTYLGFYSGFNNSSGIGNTFIGSNAGYSNNSGGNNVYLGSNAGYSATGSNNVFIGNSAGLNETGSNRLYISNSNADPTQALIYGEFDNKILRINGSGSVLGTWTFLSDRRLKQNIVNMGSTLEKTLNLRPVTYDWKDPEQAKTQGHQVGLIAQEVEELFPELVKTDSRGMKSLDYSRLSVVLIQAFKEQQQSIAKQQESITSLSDDNKQMKLQLQQLNDLKLEVEKMKSSINYPGIK